MRDRVASTSPLPAGILVAHCHVGARHPLLLAADALGVATVSTATVNALADVLDERAIEVGPSTESFENPAKTLAVDIT